MRLYEHSARCPVALRAFLDCNPMYWCFIPHLWNQNMVINFSFMGEPSHRQSEVDHLIQYGVIENPRVAYYLNRVPLPPSAYVFSYRQRQQQRFFFRNLVTGIYGDSPMVALDLYKISILAVCK